MSRRDFPIAHVERHVEEGLAKIQRCRPDIFERADGSVGKIKMLLSYLIDEGGGFIYSFFIDSLCKGPAAFVREFYIDDRAWPGTSRCNRWADPVTKTTARRVLQQLAQLEARAAKSHGLGAYSAASVEIVRGPANVGWNVRRLDARGGSFWNGEEGTDVWLSWPAQMWGQGRWQTAKEAQSAAERAGFQVQRHQLDGARGRRGLLSGFCLGC